MKFVTKKQQKEIDQTVKDKLLTAFKFGQKNPDGHEGCAKIILEEIFHADAVINN